MGATLTVEQHSNVLAGRAVCNDNYIEYPEGCAAACFYGSPKLARGLSQRNKLPFCERRPGKIEGTQAAVKEMMIRLDAEDLYREFIDQVLALIDSMWISDWNYSWRKALLSLRLRFAPRFFACGIDAWVCNASISEDWSGDPEYWIVFVDRSKVDCSKVKKLLRWHLTRALVTRQKDVATDAYSCLQQVDCDVTVNELLVPSRLFSASENPKDLPPAHYELLKGSKTKL